MIKLATYTATFLAYSVPVVRQAVIYAECEPDASGRTFEVSTHSGNVGVLWEFKPFDTLEEATLHALKFLSRSELHEKLENKA